MGKTTSIRIQDEDLWKRAKKHCVDKEVSLGAFVSDLIRNELDSVAGEKKK